MNFLNVIELLKNRESRRLLYLEFYFVLVLLINLFTNQISNYKVSSFIIKGFSLVLTFTVFFILYKYHKIDIKKLIRQKNFKPAAAFASLFLIYSSVTLLYSVNPLFGLLKTINLLISTYPLILLALFLYVTLTTERLEILKMIFLSAGIVISLLVILVYPFDHSTIYSFTMTRLSHVMVGRILGLSFITGLILLYHSKNSKAEMIYAGFLLLTGTAAYLTALRSSILGLLIVTFCAILIFRNRERVFIKAGLTLTVLILIWLSVFTGVLDKYSSSEKRIENLTTMDIENADGGMKSRIFLFDKSLELIKQHPVTGTGWGGFADPAAGIINQMTYPHNIILEALSEFGLPAGLIFTYLIFYILYRCYKSDKTLFLYVLFAFVLAMFSKDISTNGLFWLGVIVITRSESKEDNSLHKQDS